MLAYVGAKIPLMLAYVGAKIPVMLAYVGAKIPLMPHAGLCWSQDTPHVGPHVGLC